MCASAGLSPKGYEIEWATNRLGHALLIPVLLPLLTRTALLYGNARVVNITSEGLMLASADKGIVFDDLKTKQEYGFGPRWKRYGQCKLAQVLYTSQIAQRYSPCLLSPFTPPLLAPKLVQTLGLAERLLVYATSKMGSP
ncbi:hypothetical protein NU195Hw_g3451t1 [Hortaea werneckii]